MSRRGSPGDPRGAKVEKAAQEEPDINKQKHVDGALAYKVDFQACFPEILLEAASNMTKWVPTAPARADRGSDPPENQKKQRKDELRTNTFQDTMSYCQI